jgi:hypothetical protein
VSEVLILLNCKSVANSVIYRKMYSVHFLKYGRAHCIYLHIQCFSSKWSQIENLEMLTEQMCLKFYAFGTFPNLMLTGATFASKMTCQ